MKVDLDIEEKKLQFSWSGIKNIVLMVRFPLGLSLTLQIDPKSKTIDL